MNTHSQSIARMNQRRTHTKCNAWISCRKKYDVVVVAVAIAIAIVFSGGDKEFHFFQSVMVSRGSDYIQFFSSSFVSFHSSLVRHYFVFSSNRNILQSPFGLWSTTTTNSSNYYGTEIWRHIKNILRARFSAFDLASTIQPGVGCRDQREAFVSQQINFSSCRQCIGIVCSELVSEW